MAVSMASAYARRATEKHESRPQISWLDGNDVLPLNLL
nr:MAG TPA: hypothetical protein [Caudoviricetes sp.]